MEYVIQTEQLCKMIGKKNILTNVNLHLPKGSIYGLVGANGAGKSTLMRLLSGLAKQSSGRIYMFQTENLLVAGKKTACTLEAPALYTNMTAEQNMTAYALILEKTSKDDIAQCLELAGLENERNKKIKAYSQGMKQRLILAMMLLGNPELLLLDEPINGLDPVSIREVRNILLRLNQEKGVTVLISSHIIDELAKIAKIYGVMKNGELIKEVTADELSRQSLLQIVINGEQIGRAKKILTKLNIECFDINEDSIFLPNKSKKKQIVMKEFLSEDIEILKVAENNMNLENYLVELMGGAHEKINTI